MDSGGDDEDFVVNDPKLSDFERATSELRPLAAAEHMGKSPPEQAPLRPIPGPIVKLRRMCRRTMTTRWYVRGFDSYAQKFLENFAVGPPPAAEDNPLRRQFLEFQEKTKNGTAPSLVDCESFDAEESGSKAKFFGYVIFMVYTNFGEVYFLLSWEGESDRYRVVALVELPPYICLWALRPDEVSFLVNNPQLETPLAARALDTKMVRYRGTKLLREDTPTVFTKNIGRRRKRILSNSFPDPANDNYRIAEESYWSRALKRDKVFVRRLDPQLKIVLGKEFDTWTDCSFSHFANGYFLKISQTLPLGDRRGLISIDLYLPNFEYAGHVLALPWDVASGFMRSRFYPHCEGPLRQTPKVLFAGDLQCRSWEEESGDCCLIHKFYLSRWLRISDISAGEFEFNEEIFEVEISFRR